MLVSLFFSLFRQVLSFVFILWRGQGGFIFAACKTVSCKVRVVGAKHNRFSDFSLYGMVSPFGMRGQTWKVNNFHFRSNQRIGVQQYIADE